MIRLTAKEVATAIGVSPGYCRNLLSRKGLKMRQQDWPKILELILSRASDKPAAGTAPPAPDTKASQREASCSTSTK